ncbi:MAG TPA: hypothetical protein VHK06_03495 [Candidatus Limnocylindria bacterium]|nr:hypothetical protein [Candidatus Limnocylindria bacterium]
MFVPHPTTTLMLADRHQRELLDHAARVRRAAEAARHGDPVPRPLRFRITARRLAAAVSATLLAGAIAGSAAALAIEPADATRADAPASIGGGAGPKLLR